MCYWNTMVPSDAAAVPVFKTDGTALVIFVPEAEHSVGEWRLRYEWSAQHGMPPHITILLPFIESTRVTDMDLEFLKELFSKQPRFAFRLSGPTIFREYV